MKSAIAPYNSTPSLFRYKSSLKVRSPQRIVKQREDSTPSISRQIAANRAIQLSSSSLTKQVKVRDQSQIKLRIGRCPLASGKIIEAQKKQLGIPQDKKVFIISGNYPDVRTALLSRKWYENPNEESLVFDLKWSRKARIPPSLKDWQIFNHLSKNYELCCKTRLSEKLKPHKAFFPRCYKIKGQLSSNFVDKFRAVYAVSLLKGFINHESHPIENVLTATVICNRWAFCLETGQSEEANSIVLNLEWRVIQCQDPIEKQSLFKNILVNKRNGSLKEIRDHALSALIRLQKVDFQYHLNGSGNIWIVKPGGKSRGRGISVMNRLDSIRNYTDNSKKWVVQKYIENPLIVYNRKFDIRQWVLVTQFRKLKVYIYEECYLRFSVDEWNLGNLENHYIHLTNNCISKNSEKFEDSDIEGCMWHVQKFKEFLGENVWNDDLFPQIKNIVKICFGSFGNLGSNRNSFEIFGLDFMIDADLRPWLLEINSSPSMDYSTEVTKSLVKDVLNDCIKVVIDHHIGGSYDLGKFQVVYQAKL